MRFRNHQSSTGNISPEIRVMDEPQAADRELARQFLQIGSNDARFDVDQGIEAEDEIDAVVGNHRQRHAVVEMEARVRARAKAMSAMGNTALDDINGVKTLAMLQEEFRPPAMARRYLQHRSRGKRAANARVDGGNPLLLDRPPRAGPLIALARPIVARPVSPVFLERSHVSKSPIRRLSRRERVRAI